MKLPKILIVDDRQYDRILYREYLGESSYDYHEIDDGEFILQAIESFKPDLILLDWQMPRVGGLESLKNISRHRIYKEIPIIIITGLEDDKVLEEAFDYGSIDFLNKPVSKVEITARVNSALNLYETKKILIQKSDELGTLNEIIKSQKQELQKSLELKTDLLDQNIEDHEKVIGQKNRQYMSMQIDSNKLVNDIKAIKSALREAHDMLKTQDPSSKVIKKLSSIERALDRLEINDDSWSDFKEAFESIDPAFYEKLSKINPKLTPLDLKHCAFIKLNLDNYEVSNILNVELKSLQMTRYRLKKKLKLGEKDMLREFIIQL